MGNRLAGEGLDKDLPGYYIACECLDGDLHG